MLPELVAGLAVEWWRSAGDRTQARLAALVDHFGRAHGLLADDRRAALAIAQSRGRLWSSGVRI